MSNQSFRRYGSRTLAVLGATLGFGACGESPTEPDSMPEVIFVEFEASGVVERDGQPVRGAKVVLMRCERMGAAGCEEEKSLAIAMTSPTSRLIMTCRQNGLQPCHHPITCLNNTTLSNAARNPFFIVRLLVFSLIDWLTRAASMPDSNHFRGVQ